MELLLIEKNTIKKIITYYNQTIEFIKINRHNVNSDLLDYDKYIREVKELLLELINYDNDKNLIKDNIVNYNFVWDINFKFKNIISINEETKRNMLKFTKTEFINPTQTLEKLDKINKTEEKNVIDIVISKYNSTNQISSISPLIELILNVQTIVKVLLSIKQILITKDQRNGDEYNEIKYIIENKKNKILYDLLTLNRHKKIKTHNLIYETNTVDTKLFENNPHTIELNLYPYQYQSYWTESEIIKYLGLSKKNKVNKLDTSELVKLNIGVIVVNEVIRNNVLYETGKLTKKNNYTPQSGVNIDMIKTNDNIYFSENKKDNWEFNIKLFNVQNNTDIKLFAINKLATDKYKILINKYYDEDAKKLYLDQEILRLIYSEKYIISNNVLKKNPKYISRIDSFYMLTDNTTENLMITPINESKININIDIRNLLQSIENEISDYFDKNKSTFTSNPVKNKEIFDDLIHKAYLIHKIMDMIINFYIDYISTESYIIKSVEQKERVIDGGLENNKLKKILSNEIKISLLSHISFLYTLIVKDIHLFYVKLDFSDENFSHDKIYSLKENHLKIIMDSVKKNMGFKANLFKIIIDKYQKIKTRLMIK